MSQGDKTRRDAMRRIGLGLALPSVASFAGCTGGPESTPTSREGSPTATSLPQRELQFGFGTAEASSIPFWTGSREIAPERHPNFDIVVKIFDSSDIGTQAMLAGEVSGSNFGSTGGMPIIRRTDAKMFTSYVRSSDYVLVGNENVNSLADIVNKDIRIGVNTLTGPSYLQMIIGLQNEGLIDRPQEVQDKTVRIGFSGSRMAAMLGGDIDVSAQHYSQFKNMQSQDPGRFTNLITFADLENYNGSVLIATEEALNEKSTELEWMTEGLLLACREMYNDADLFVRTMNKFVPGGGPSEDELRSVYEFYNNNKCWPINGGLTEETMSNMVNLAVQAEIIPDPIPLDDLMTRDILDSVLDNIGTAEYPFE